MGGMMFAADTPKKPDNPTITDAQRVELLQAKVQFQELQSQILLAQNQLQQMARRVEAMTESLRKTCSDQQTFNEQTLSCDLKMASKVVPPTEAKKQ